MQEWKYSPDLQKFRFRKWLNLRKMWLFFFCSTLSHIYFDILFCPQLFERELRRWAGHERNMSLSSHALYDNKQVHTLTSETKLMTLICLLKISRVSFCFFLYPFREFICERRRRRRYLLISVWSSFLRQRETPERTWRAATGRWSRYLMKTTRRHEHQRDVASKIRPGTLRSMFIPLWDKILQLY